MFDAVPANSYIPLQQSSGFARAARLMGLPMQELDVAGHGHALMQTRHVPVLGWFGLISRGPVWTGVPEARALAAVLSDLGHPVVLNAENMSAGALRSAGFWPLMSAATMARLDLTAGPEGMRARMHQKWRNRLHRAEASALKVRRSVLPDDPRHPLILAERAQRKHRGYRGVPPELAAAFSRANPHMAQLFEAQMGREVVASMLFLRHGPTATYFVGHTTEDGRKLHAHNLLLMEAAAWLSAHGTDALDLGALDTLNSPGLARFKLGSGAQPHVLGGTWLYARRLAGFGRKRAVRQV